MTADQSAVPDYPQALRLDGRGFVLLGAGQGIGRQAAHALAQAGADLLLVDHVAARAEQVATETGGTACIAEVTTRAGMDAVFAAAAARFGDRLSGVVDIIGMADNQPIAEAGDAVWDWHFDIVLRHAWLAIQACAAGLGERGGSMVFVGSMSGSMSIPKQGIYGAAKAALHHLVACAAVELGPRNIRINAVAPGFVRTPRLVAAFDEDFWGRVGAAIPLGRPAEPADIAKAILFLASDLSGCISGAVLPVDGALTRIAAVPAIPIRGAAGA